MKGMGTYGISVDSMPGDANTPDAFVEFAKKNFPKYMKNCKFGASSILTVSGADARRFEFTGESSGLPMKYIILYVFKDGRAHTLTCGAVATDFAGFKADYEKVIASAVLQ